MSSSTVSARPSTARAGGWRRRLQPLKTSYHLASRLAETVPLHIGYSLLAFGGSVWYRASRQQRRHALENYGTVLGFAPENPLVQRVAERAFRNYGKMLLDFVRIGSAPVEELLQRVSHDGKENLDAALAHGCGAIVAVPHMGSWDMGGAAIGILGYPTYAVADAFPGSLNDAVVSTRERFGLKVILLDRSAVRRILNALAGNAVVALMCDIEHGPGVTVDFFGRRAIVPSGPASFALKTGAPVLPGYMYRTSDGYHAHIDAPLDVPTTGDRRSDVQRIMQVVVRRFEDFIRPRPDEWYAFRRVFLPN